MLSAIAPDRFEAVAAQLTRLGEAIPVHLGGAGADRAFADAVGAHSLAADPVSAAAAV